MPKRKPIERNSFAGMNNRSFHSMYGKSGFAVFCEKRLGGKQALSNALKQPDWHLIKKLFREFNAKQ